MIIFLNILFFALGVSLVFISGAWYSESYQNHDRRSLYLSMALFFLGIINLFFSNLGMLLL